MNARGKGRINRESKKRNIFMAVVVAFFVHSMFIICTRTAHLATAGGGDIRAFVTFCYLVLFIVLGAYQNDWIVWYLGSFQVTYAVMAILMLSVTATIYRFINVYAVMVPVIYILIKNRSAAVRILSVVLSVAVIASLTFADFAIIYRDASFSHLTDRVASGVYKGIYTTPTRAEDLPEMEAYLNSVIDENETYAFRDNSPFAYLMIHKGKVCDLQTWDVLQYSDNGNDPQKLYDYYRVRDMIPDKIIYIQREVKLSIEDDNFKYNKWVNSYYDLVEKVEMNDTFPLVLVYQYNGTFDGDYQRWIDEALEPYKK